MDRRVFLKTTEAADLGGAIGFQGAEANQTALSKRKLGRTGEHLSLIGLGGITVSDIEQEEANRIVREAIDRGVNYFDVAPAYSNAEERLGPALQGYRDRIFLACKTGQRDKEGAGRELHESLRRLRTDHLDLYQLHGLTTLEDVEKVLEPDGAMEAFLNAREEGLIRFIGFSAHSVEAAFMAIERFDFDTILFPFNWVCYFQGDFGSQVLKAAQEKGMGCLALKAMARTRWTEGATQREEYPKCWYQPVTEQQEASLALRFTLSEPVTAAIPPGDERLFKLALSIAEQFTPLTAAEHQHLRERATGLQPIFRYPQA